MSLNSSVLGVYRSWLYICDSKCSEQTVTFWPWSPTFVSTISINLLSKTSAMVPNDPKWYLFHNCCQCASLCLNNLELQSSLTPFKAHYRLHIMSITHVHVYWMPICEAMTLYITPLCRWILCEIRTNKGHHNFICDYKMPTRVGRTCFSSGWEMALNSFFLTSKAVDPYRATYENWSLPKQWRIQLSPFHFFKTMAAPRGMAWHKMASYAVQEYWKSQVDTIELPGGTSDFLPPRVENWRR